MSLTVLWLVGRLTGSVGASLLQKRLLAAGLAVHRLWWVTYGILAVPGLVLMTTHWKAGQPEFWRYAILAALLDVAGNLAMAAALRETDLSVFGPLNALRPALALVVGYLWLGESPTFSGLAGMAVIVAGALWLVRSEAPHTSPGGGVSRWTAFGWRVLGLAISTLGAGCLKRATALGGPELTLGVWICGGWFALAVLGRIELRRNAAGTPPPIALLGRWLALHAVAFFLMQWLTLKVFEHTLLSYSFAFFQLGMVLQVVLGSWWFGEPHFGRRLLCCGVMSAGACWILFRG